MPYKNDQITSVRISDKAEMTITDYEKPDIRKGDVITLKNFGCESEYKVTAVDDKEEHTIRLSLRSNT